MEELLELKNLIVKRDYDAALALLEELEEMSRKDIINNIYSFGVILLLHLIKRQVEQRTTRSWDISIKNAALRIGFFNKRPKGRGFYLDSSELAEVLFEAWHESVNLASREALEGVLSFREVEERVDRRKIVDTALSIISSHGLWTA